jgi:hypothetical protein
MILEAHNFVCIPLIEVRFENKVLSFNKIFSTVYGMPPTHKEIMVIPNF